MDSLAFTIINIICAVSFLVYSISCLTTVSMEEEYQRYGLARYRILTGGTQLFGVAGLLVGFHTPSIGAFAAGGLTLQMLLAIGVRAKIKDKPIQYLPAVIYLLLNGWLLLQYLSF